MDKPKITSKRENITQKNINIYVKSPPRNSTLRKPKKTNVLGVSVFAIDTKSDHKPFIMCVFYIKNTLLICHVIGGAQNIHLVLLPLSILDVA